MNTLLEPGGDKTAVAPMPVWTNPPLRILLVEDDLDLGQFSALLLVRADHRADTAEDDAAGWGVLQVNHDDLLITDDNLAKVTGLERVKNKKRRAARMPLPVILTTGALPMEELDRHPPLQLTATLENPFASEELPDALKKVLRPPTARTADRVTARLTEPATCG